MHVPNAESKLQTLCMHAMHARLCSTGIQVERAADVNNVYAFIDTVEVVTFAFAYLPSA